MARRKGGKHHKAHAGSINQIFARAKREYDKGNFKDALKEAKICHRQQATPEHRRFLEQAYFARADKMFELGQREDSIAVVKELQQLGPTEETVRNELPKLLIKLGVYKPSSDGAGDNGSPVPKDLETLAVDQAVLDEKAAQGASTEIRANAAKVRLALDCLAEGRDDEAAQHVKDFGRNSAWSDWRMFVRGLSAYYRQETQTMQACWSRLDPQRIAATIAEPLCLLDASASQAPGQRSAQKPGSQPPPNHQQSRSQSHFRFMIDPNAGETIESGQSSNASSTAPMTSQQRSSIAKAMRIIERHAMGESILSRLAELRDAVAVSDWKGTMGALQRSAPSIRRYDRSLLQRITAMLLRPILHDGKVRLLQRLEKHGEPASIDPHWNRVWAMMWEDGQFDAGKSESRWLKFLQDLEGLPGMTENELKLAQSLVWTRIGDSYMGQYHASEQPSFFDEEYDDFDEELENYERRAVECFRESIRLAPNSPHGYEHLAAAQQDFEHPDLAASTFREMLEHNADHLPALEYLVDFHQQRDEPDHALDYLQRIYRLRPLDKQTIESLAQTHLGVARRCALRKDWDQGRKHFTEAHQLSPELGGGYSALACRAAFEFKAGKKKDAEQFVEQAENKLEEPTAALLDLAIEAARYNLPKKTCQAFNRRWKAALKKKCSSQTAGQMCRSMAANSAAQVDYEGRSDHVHELLAYVKRCTRFTWQETDLRHVSLFVFAQGPPQAKLLEKFLKRGRKVFPDSPFFHYYTGQLDMLQVSIRSAHNPLMAIRNIRSSFAKVLDLTKDGAAAEDAHLIEKAKRQMTMLHEMERMFQIAPPMPFGGHYFDDEDDDDDEYF